MQYRPMGSILFGVFALTAASLPLGTYAFWNYGTSENPVYAESAPVGSFVSMWNYGTADAPIWFSLGSSVASSVASTISDSITLVTTEVRDTLIGTSTKENQSLTSTGVWTETIIQDAGNLVYSPDGKEFAYIKKAGEQYTVVKNGVEGAKYDEISDLTYSPDGKSFAYVAELDEKDFIVRDGIMVSSGYHGIDALTYSPNGKSFFYRATDNKGKEFLVKDGVESNRYDFVRYAFYSPDSMSFTFVANQNDVYVIVKDGIELSKKYNRFRLEPMYSLDGKSLTYAGVDENKKNIFVKDGVEVDIGDMMVLEAAYTPDKKHFAYSKSLMGYSAIMVVDGVESPEYTMARFPTYSPDGKSFAYAASINNKYAIIKDGIELPGEVDVLFTDPIVYSPDSKYFSYIIKADDKYKIIKDGGESMVYDGIEDMIYSPDSKEFVYIAQLDGKYFIVKDGVEGQRYDRISRLSYSLDGKSFSYTAFDGDKKFIVKQDLVPQK